MSTFNERIVVLLQKVLRRCCRTVEHVQEHGGAGEGEGRLLPLVHPLVGRGPGEDVELDVAGIAPIYKRRGNDEKRSKCCCQLN